MRTVADTLRCSAGRLLAISVLGTFSLTPISSVPAAAQELIPDNLAILQSLAQEQAETIMQHVLSAGARQLFLINIPPQDEASWLLESALLPKASGENIAIIQAGYQGDRGDTSLNENALILEYKVAQAGVHYTPIKDRLLRHAEIERIVTLDIFIKLTQSDGRLLWSELIRSGQEDVLTSAQLPQVNNAEFPFTFAELPARSGVKTLIEPLLIMGVTGTIIYLFYSFRSK